MKQPTIRGWAWIIASLAFASLSALAIVSVIALAPNSGMVREATAPILPLYSAATAQERGLRDELAAAYRWVGSGSQQALAELQAMLSRPAPAQDPRLRSFVPQRFRERLDRADSLVASAEAHIKGALAEQAGRRQASALALLAAASADRRLVASQMSQLVAASVDEARAVQERVVAAEARARLAIAASVVLALALLAASVTLMRVRVIRPMARLHDDVRRIAAGDLAHRARVTSDDEVGELARDVNQMTGALETRLQQHARLTAVGELAAGLAHELNNPLQVILAQSSHALQASAPEETGEAMRLIQEQARRAGRVVAGLVSFVRARATERQPSDINAIVSDTVGLLDDEFRAERVGLETRLTPHLPVVRADRAQIEQVLVNLLANALHAAARAGDPRIVAVETRGETDTVVIAVEDSGPGVPPEVRPRIFDPFFTTNATGGNIGLGLSIAAQIANGHSGTLALVDGALGGARFELRLPAEPVPAAARRASRPAPTSPNTPQGVAPADACCDGLRLLVADDEEAVRRTWDRYFTRLGAKVTGVRDGRQALDLIRRQDWDAIVLDLKMPVMNGWDVVLATRQERPELAGRIVVLSGDVTGLLELQTSEHLEPWRVLEKPADLETIREAVVRAWHLPRVQRLANSD
jgi:signal transduction histidine kinase/ActR/RegA family two-component response regulator